MRMDNLAGRLPRATWLAVILLLGAAYGREAFPARWVFPVLACRPLTEAASPRPRPMEYWPDDVLELAEALLG